MQPNSSQASGDAKRPLTERALETPISDIEFGTASLRRKLVKAGIKTVGDLLTMPSHDIDRSFSYNDAGMISNLIDKLQRNPDSTVIRLLGREHDSSHADARPSFMSESVASPQACHANWNGNDELPLPTRCKPLESIDNDAGEVLTELSAQGGQVLAYRAFPDLEERMPTLSNGFSELFRRYSSSEYPIVQVIEQHFPDAFIIFMAYRASQDFDGENLWGNLFKKIGIRDGNLQTSLKKLFVSLLERRGMPVFAQDEETFCYFYTALLHGGLSKNLWKSLWRKSLLPLANKELKNYGGVPHPLGGEAILNSIKTPSTAYAPGHAIMNLMNHISSSTLSPLLESAFQVALDVQQSLLVGSQCQLVSSDTLSKVSLEALSEVMEEAASTSESVDRSVHNSRPSPVRIACLPLAQMVLDPISGTVRFVWKPCHLDQSFSGNNISFSINGERRDSIEIEQRVGSAFFRGITINADPSAHYDVLIQLESTSDADTAHTLSSKSIQHFLTQQRGCYEFFEGSKGTYRLRKPKERITRTRKVAYLVDSGLELIPKSGMTNKEKLDMPGNWVGAHIYIFDVEQGSSGSIVDSATRKTVATWHENYQVSICKDFTIGKTTEGLDAYGYMPSTDNVNKSLPTLTIETLDGVAAAGNITCMCNADGIEFPLDTKIIAQKDSRASTVILNLQRVPQIGLHVQRCTIKAFADPERQTAILHYSFSVIPIQDFHPELRDFKPGSPTMARYIFTAAMPLRVTGAGLDRPLPEGAEADIVIPLSEESLELSFETQVFSTPNRPNKLKTSVYLALAGVEIELPRPLLDAASSGDVTIADLLDCTPSERAIVIACHGHRNIRGMYVSLGYSPLFYGDLRAPGRYRLDLYSQPTLFASDGKDTAKRMELRAILRYGDDSHSRDTFSATSSMTILSCIKGLGFSSWKLCVSKNNEEMLRLDAPILCDAKASFCHRGYLRDSLLGAAKIHRGDDRIPLSNEIVHVLDTGKSIVMEISPTNLFGDTIPELSHTYLIEGEQHGLQR